MSALTYAVTHEIEFYGERTSLRVLTLTEDLAKAQAEAEALNDAEYSVYNAWMLGHNEAANHHVVFEVAGYIDYDDWSCFPADLFDAACAISEERNVDPENSDETNDAVDDAAADLGYGIARYAEDLWTSECILLRVRASDFPRAEAAA